MELKGAICFFRCCSKKYSEKVRVFLSFRLRVQILNHLSIKDSWCSAYETVVLSFDFHSSFTLSHSEELLVDLSKKWEKKMLLARKWLLSLCLWQTVCFMFSRWRENRHFEDVCWPRRGLEIIFFQEGNFNWMNKFSVLIGKIPNTRDTSRSLTSPKGISYGSVHDGVQIHLNDFKDVWIRRRVFSTPNTVMTRLPVHQRTNAHMLRVKICFFFLFRLICMFLT